MYPRFAAGLPEAITNLFLLDYLHITKRFGHIAASQFPLHYALSMKSLYSPLAFVFQSSHEQLNPWHRLSGRIIYFLLLNHAIWYINFFVQAGILYKRLTALVVIIGIVAFLMITILATTSLETIRRWSYRVFFVFHVIIGVSVLPLLFFHASELRLYTVEALALFVFDIVCRKLDTVTGFATIAKIPHTKLLSLKVPVPASKLPRFKAAPGQHVYLSIPPESVPPNKSPLSIHNLLFNPFTIADVSSTDVTLILRSLHGPTTLALDTLSGLSKARPPINIEGPYGTTRKFPNLVEKYDRILLVAGGVGATFVLPIYRDLRDQIESDSKSPDRLTFIWSMRSAAEAFWAVDTTGNDSLKDDEHVKIYLTRSSTDDRRHDEPADGSVELDDLRAVKEPLKPSGGKERPNLKKIVDDVFRAGNQERVAVLVCGPTEMARELRKHVGSWVMKGREVWWHDESLYETPHPFFCSFYPRVFPSSFHEEMLTLRSLVGGSY
jgi:NAD(P)H-flavin reductase